MIGLNADPVGDIPEASDNIGFCKFGSEEVSGSLRLGNVWVGRKWIGYSRGKYQTCLKFFRPLPTQTDSS